MGALRKGREGQSMAKALETLQVVLEEPSKVGKTSDRDLGSSQKFSCVSILSLFAEKFQGSPLFGPAAVNNI